jgi:phosphate transport system protein
MQHLSRDLDLLKRRLLTLGERVLDAVRDATAALVESNETLARQVIEGEHIVDELEVEVEEECLKLLALHQPVAGNLRLVVTALKVDNDLERMGDAAESIALRAMRLMAAGPVAIPPDLLMMVQSARGMTRKALESLIQEDVDLARQVLTDDRAVDAGQRGMFKTLQERMRQDPASVESSVLLLSATRQVERIADLATNIAEDVIFLQEGEIVRHKRTNPE